MLRSFKQYSSFLVSTLLVGGLAFTLGREVGSFSTPWGFFWGESRSHALDERDRDVAETSSFFKPDIPMPQREEEIKRGGRKKKHKRSFGLRPQDDRKTQNNGKEQKTARPFPSEMDLLLVENNDSNQNENFDSFLLSEFVHQEGSERAPRTEQREIAVGDILSHPQFVPFVPSELLGGVPGNTAVLEEMQGDLLLISLYDAQGEAHLGDFQIPDPQKIFLQNAKLAPVSEKNFQQTNRHLIFRDIEAAEQTPTLSPGVLEVSYDSFLNGAFQIFEEGESKLFKISPDTFLLLNGTR